MEIKETNARLEKQRRGRNSEKNVGSKDGGPTTKACAKERARSEKGYIGEGPRVPLGVILGSRERRQVTGDVSLANWGLK